MLLVNAVIHRTEKSTERVIWEFLKLSRGHSCVWTKVAWGAG